MSEENAKEKKYDFSNITTYAFVGPAGTGKSQRALLVATKLGADYVIDDGLVIYKGSLVSGRSAKAERNQVSAIRRAMFEFDDHRREVQEFFEKAETASIMVIGTSEGMAEKILRKLEMPLPKQVVHIEEVSSAEEITKARNERFKKGQHVIPISHVLVRKNFAGKLVGRLRVFWKSKDSKEGEKTIVRPPFSFFGEVHIEPEAIEQMATFITARTTQIDRVVSLSVTPGNLGLVIEVNIAVTPGDKKFVALAALVKERIAVSVRYFTGLDVKKVDVNISEVVIP